MDTNTKEKTKINKTMIYYALSILSFCLFIILIILLKCLDVKNIGPNNSSIGLATINNFFVKNLDNFSWFKIITDIFGILSILIMVEFCIIGGYQLIKRKSIAKVDRDIILLGFIYVLIIAIYIFFEIVVINYRPILVDDVLEASFPSSHTLLILTVCSTSIIEINDRIDNKTLKTIFIVLLSIIMVVTFFGRFACGYHWFTDVLASLFISLSLTFLFAGLKRVLIK